MIALLWMAPLAPLAVIPCLLFGRGRRWALLLAALAVSPSLALALAADDHRTSAPWLLSNVELVLDDTGRVFLLLSGLVWGLAGIYAHGSLRGARLRFALFWLVTMSGSIGTTIAGDAVTFYTAFVVMTFAAYGLIVHEGRAAHRAGGIYLAMAVVGEVMLLGGLAIAVWSAGMQEDFAQIRGALTAGAHRHMAIALLVGGFGVKAGLAGLHFWMPLAYRVAPAPASAVLSAAMSKAGLLGLLRFLPLGEASAEGWAVALAVLGFVATFGGVVVGTLQRDAKSALAYSSISQMGLMVVGVSAALGTTAAYAAALTAVTVFALHEGLAKAALFMGAPLPGAVRDPRIRTGVIGVLAMLGLALAAAPLTSGFIAKGYVKAALHEAPHWLSSPAALLLPLSSVATALLMIRFVYLVARAPRATTAEGVSRSEAAAWGCSVFAAAALVWLLPARIADHAALLHPGALWDASWPLALFAGVAALAFLTSRSRGRPPMPHLPPGDVVIALESAVARVARLNLASVGMHGTLPARRNTLTRSGLAALGEMFDIAERSLSGWPVAGILFTALMAAFVVLLQVR